MDEHELFRQTVRASSLQDPMPTLRALGGAVGLTIEEIIHHALVRWVSAGSEALMTISSLALEDLIDGRKREDWKSVAGIIDWLEAGTKGEGYRQ